MCLSLACFEIGRHHQADGAIGLGPLEFCLSGANAQLPNEEKDIVGLLVA
jgi:hypothetical protein